MKKVAQAQDLTISLYPSLSPTMKQLGRATTSLFWKWITMATVVIFEVSNKDFQKRKKNHLVLQNTSRMSISYLIERLLIKNIRSGTQIWLSSCIETVLRSRPSPTTKLSMTTSTRNRWEESKIHTEDICRSLNKNKVKTSPHLRERVQFFQRT